MAALRARHLYHRDQHYVVQDGEVVIVDEFTGPFDAGSSLVVMACIKPLRPKKMCHPG
jgi:hypothetical protein